MPLIHFEYTANLPLDDPKAACVAINQLLVKTCHAKLNSCKSLITRTEDYVVGDNTDPEQGYISILIGLLPGRTQQQKDDTAQQIFQLMCQQPRLQNVLNKLQIRVQLYDLLDIYFFN